MSRGDYDSQLGFQSSGAGDLPELMQASEPVTKAIDMMRNLHAITPLPSLRDAGCRI